MKLSEIYTIFKHREPPSAAAKAGEDSRWKFDTEKKGRVTLAPSHADAIRAANHFID